MNLNHYAIWPCLQPFLCTKDQVHVWHTNREYSRVLAPFVIKNLRIYLDASDEGPMHICCSSSWRQHITKAMIRVQGRFYSFDNEYLSRWILQRMLFPFPDLFSRLRDLHVPCSFGLAFGWMTSLNSLEKLTLGCLNGRHLSDAHLIFDHLPGSLQEVRLIGDMSFTSSTFAGWPGFRRMCSKLSVIQRPNSQWIWMNERKKPIVPEGVSHLSIESWAGLVGYDIQKMWPRTLRELYVVNAWGSLIISTSVFGLRTTCLEVFFLDTKQDVLVANDSLPSSLQKLTIHTNAKTVGARYEDKCLPSFLTYLDIGDSLGSLNSISQLPPSITTLIIGRRVAFLSFTQLSQLHTLTLDDTGHHSSNDSRHLIAYAGDIPSTLCAVDARIKLWDMCSEEIACLPPSAKRSKTSIV